MKNFVYTSQPARIVFGAGSLSQLAREIDALGSAKALILSTPEQRASAERVADLLGNRAAGIFDRAVMHVPIETAREARELARKLGADCAVAIGGGSTTGLGKAIALDSGLPILAIPTTYAGSEMTPIYGITEAGLKKTGRDLRVLPRTVIYDPELTLSLPVGMSVTSGINAIAHAAEGLYATDGNPIMDLMAKEGIAALGQALPAIKKRANDMDPRAEAPGAMQTIADALNGNVKGCSAAQAVFDLAKNNGAPVALRDIGMKQSDLDKACDIALQNQYPNPRPLERNAIRQLLQDAFEGARPRA